MGMKLILASQSPRRRELLSRLRPKFLTVPADVDEHLPSGVAPRAAVCLLAEKKAEAVARLHPNDVVIGSDTIVAFEGEILGKPASAADAVQMLKRLRGRTHSVFTGVCVITPQGKVTEADETAVTMNALTESQIEAYVKSGSPLDKAGSYGIQDAGIVRGYCGSYTNVMGFPLELVEKLLEKTAKEVGYD